MKQHYLGKEGLVVSALGLGCMSVSPFYGVPDDSESIHLLRQAYEWGVNFYDTSDLYGFGHSEKLVGKAIKPFRDKVVLATKGGLVIDADNEKPVPKGVNTTAKYIRTAVEKSLTRLDTDYIDLYYLHRIDPITPVEETICELKKLIQEGKIKHIGLSEATAEQIKHAHAIHPIAALQSEYSLWYRQVEREILPLCQKLNIGFVPFSPLGRGFLTGTITSSDSLQDYDFRKNLPRFFDENIRKNKSIIDRLTRISKNKSCSLAQLALAWLYHQADNIVPIPGVSRLEHLAENMQAIDINLTIEDLDLISEAVSQDDVAGDQFTEGAKKIFQTFYAGTN